MYTKSIIQQTVESLRARDSFRTAIENLMEKYNIEDSVFVFKNGFLYEATTGYFVIENEFDNLNEAVSSCNLNIMGIRVMGNKFQTGKIHNRIFECDENKKVFDITRLKDIE